MSDSSDVYIKRLCSEELDILSMLGVVFQYSETNLLPAFTSLSVADKARIKALVWEVFYRRIVNASPEDGYRFFLRLVMRYANEFGMACESIGQKAMEEILSDQFKLSECLENPTYLREEYKPVINNLFKEDNGEEAKE